MSHIICKCGYRISAVSDAKPYEATIIPNTLKHQFARSLASDVDQFMVAKVQDKKNEWLNKRFYSGYTDHGEVEDADVIKDLVYEYYGPAPYMFQCDNCGRILIEGLREPSRCCSFVPETSDGHGLLVARAYLDEDEEPANKSEPPAV